MTVLKKAYPEFERKKVVKEGKRNRCRGKVQICLWKRGSLCPFSFFATTLLHCPFVFWIYGLSGKAGNVRRECLYMGIGRCK